MNRKYTRCYYAPIGADSRQLAGAMLRALLRDVAEGSGMMDHGDEYAGRFEITSRSKEQDGFIEGTVTVRVKSSE